MLNNYIASQYQILHTIVALNNLICNAQLHHNSNYKWKQKQSKKTKNKIK